SWQAPEAIQDDDFGDTPVVFLGPNNHNWLAVGNKDGYLYVLDTTAITAGPVWKLKMANGGGNPIKGIIAPTAFLAGSVTNPSSGQTCAHGVLFLAAGNTTLAGKAVGGSISAMCADTGAILWQSGTTGLVWAAPTLANGLLADQQGKTEELRDWTTGQVLQHFTLSQNIYDAATFANSRLYVGANDHALYAFGL
ncbi:MAG TPA: hypothetical protein VGN32_21220, partial [Ktedonobacterales bacterium]|nr:hypothetical protein [Ktedonobacterales bacterium]